MILFQGGVCKLKPVSITIKKKKKPRGVANKLTVEIKCNHKNTLLIQRAQKGKNNEKSNGKNRKK